VHSGEIILPYLISGIGERSLRGWTTESNYFWDRKTLLRGPVEDDTLDFSGPKPIVLPPLQRAQPVLQQAAE